MTRDDQDKHWHLDKTVPIAMIVTILVQSGAALWWASAVNTRVDQLERQASAASPNVERIVRLETKMDSIYSALSEIKLLIQRPPNAR